MNSRHVQGDAILLQNRSPRARSPRAGSGAFVVSPAGDGIPPDDRVPRPRGRLPLDDHNPVVPSRRERRHPLSDLVGPGDPHPHRRPGPIRPLERLRSIRGRGEGAGSLFGFRDPTVVQRVVVRLVPPILGHLRDGITGIRQARQYVGSSSTVPHTGQATGGRSSGSIPRVYVGGPGQAEGYAQSGGDPRLRSHAPTAHGSERGRDP